MDKAIIILAARRLSILEDFGAAVAAEKDGFHESSARKPPWY